MKKLFYVMIAMFAMTFASCGGNKADNAVAENDSTVVDSIDSVTVDTLVLDTIQ